MTFDPAIKRIVLDSTELSATEIYSRSLDWLATSDNIKYGPIFNQVGGDDLGGGLLIPPYYFLLNGWRVRPMESSHVLIITGNIFVAEGGQPVVSTVGNYNVIVQYTVPVQAQAFATGGSTYTPTQIATAVWENSEALIVRKMLANKVVKVGNVITIYDDDNTTAWRQYDLSDDGRVIV